MPYLETEITVQASPQRCFEIARNMEKFPEFMPSVDEITVIEKGENWAKTRWVARLQGRPVTWVEREQFDPENLDIDYYQVEGDLKTFEGSWKFREHEDGCHIALDVNASLGVPMLAAALDPLIKKLLRDNCMSMLEGIRDEAEAGR